MTLFALLFVSNAWGVIFAAMTSARYIVVEPDADEAASSNQVRPRTADSRWRCFP